VFPTSNCYHESLLYNLLVLHAKLILLCRLWYMNKSVPQANIFISLSEISPSYFQLYLKNCTTLILYIHDSLMCLRIT
jgi:hypothetical protein